MCFDLSSCVFCHAGSVVVDYTILPGNELETPVAQALYLIQSAVQEGRFKLVHKQGDADREITAKPESFKSWDTDPGEQARKQEVMLLWGLVVSCDRER